MIEFIVWLDEIVYPFALLASRLVIFGIGVQIRGDDDGDELLTYWLISRLLSWGRLLTLS